jgi:3-methyladenine DNA glycosylase Tag
VRDNAVFLSELRNDGGAGVVIGGWPASDFIGVLELLKKRGSRLGGTTAQYALRSLGKDSFVLSTDVTARLVAEGIIDRPATSKRAMTAVQTAFNEWSEQSGRSLTEISQVLAMSV